jgi:hypothetical protein
MNEQRNREASLATSKAELLAVSARAFALARLAIPFSRRADSGVIARVGMPLWAVRFLRAVVVAVVQSVLSVFRLRSISQVRDVVVRLIVVQVSRFQSDWQWANERLSDKPVDGNSSRSSSARELDVQVSPSASGLPNETALAPLSAVAPHLSVRRHVVQSLVSSNGTPLFRCVRFVFSQDVNLQRQVSFWSGSFGVSASFEPFVL